MKDLTSGFLALAVALGMIVLIVVAANSDTDTSAGNIYDSTDPAYDPAKATEVDNVLRDVLLKDAVGATGEHSGLIILTDCMTGGQYLTTRNGGLTPRLHGTGGQVFKACVKPLGNP